MLGVIGVKVQNAAQAAGLLSRAARSRELTALTAREVIIDSDQPQIPVGIDGESVLMPTPVSCTIRPLVLRVRVPRGLPASPRRGHGWTGHGSAAWRSRSRGPPAAPMPHDRAFHDREILRESFAGKHDVPAAGEPQEVMPANGRVQRVARARRIASPRWLWRAGPRQKVWVLPDARYHP